MQVFRVLVISLALVLAGCAGKSVLQGGSSLTASINNPVTPSMLYDAQNALVVAVSGALAYKRLCIQKAVPSSCRAVIQRLQTYTRKAKVYLADARKFVKENDQINAIQAYNLFVAEAGKFRDEAAANGVQQP